MFIALSWTWSPRTRIKVYGLISLNLYGFRVRWKMSGCSYGRETWRQGHSALRCFGRTGRASDCLSFHLQIDLRYCLCLLLTGLASASVNRGAEEDVVAGSSWGGGILMRMLSTCLWTVLFTLNSWPRLDASPLRGSYEVAEWFSKLIQTLDEHSHCLTTPLETTKLYENVRNVRCQSGSADIMREKSEAARLLQAFPPTLHPCPSWQGHLTADWGTECLFSPHSEWPNLTARADLRLSRPL